MHVILCGTDGCAIVNPRDFFISSLKDVLNSHLMHKCTHAYMT